MTSAKPVFGTLAMALAVLLAPSIVHGGQLIWQLGTPNGSERDFRPHYNAWEYGNAPDIQKSPAMDHKTHTFQYEIKENKLISDPAVVSGLATETAQAWMHADEIVSGLRLVWKESAPGNRLLTLNAVNWSNPMNGRDGIEVTLPDGGVKVFDLPDGSGKKGEAIPFEVVFPVRAGVNGMTVRIVSRRKHYRFQFDSIALSATDRKPDTLPPLLKSKFSAPDGIYHPGEPVKLAFGTKNLSNGSLSYVVKDAFGKQVAAGTAKIADSKAELTLPASTRGWFGVDLLVEKQKFHTAYSVIEPVKAEYIADSRFGCHALETDGYQLRNWPEVQDRNVRRAFLAGAKWLRHHSMHWFLREPEKGKFDWTSFDDRLAVAEKYKMNVMLTFGGTPKWASASDNTKMTVCGTFYYQNYPPKNWQDWADFITAVVSRYKDKIRWYELWNEPGYSSAFWTNGSPEEFGMLLKTGYEAAKKADPECVVLSGAPLPPTDFLDRAVKSTGGKLYFDMMSVHYLGNGERGGELFSRWKTELARLGKPDMPFVNSEEMHWGGKREFLEAASILVQVYVREAALGIRKTFAFDFFRSGSGFNASSFDWEGNVLPNYAAYRTMTHRLEYAEFVADLSTAEVEAYLFDRRGTAVLVLWGEPGQTFELPVGDGKLTLIDLMDVEKTVSGVNGVLRLEAGTVPLFLEGGNPELLKSYGKLAAVLPRKLTVKPGDFEERNLRLDPAVSGLALTLPAGWTGSADRETLRLTVPRGTGDGIYDAAIAATVGGVRFQRPFLVEADSRNSGNNLVQNGDFTRGNAFWFFPKEENQFVVIDGAGIDGKPALRTKGTVFFGCVGGIKVRPGEKYALVAEAEGEGSFGCVYSLKDRNGKTVFPQQQGINCLSGRLNPEWKTFAEEISITQPDAAELKFAVLANYGDKAGSEARFNRFAIVRLTDRFTLSHAVWQGKCVRTAGAPADWDQIPAMTVKTGNDVVDRDKVKWKGPDDLSASCRLAMDKQFLYLDFRVKDDVSCPPEPGQGDEWKNDSLQIAFDPLLEGRDRTEIEIFQDRSGTAKAYKLNNFWTPELPENLTRHGLMTGVKSMVRPIDGGREYLIAIPLQELYPLTAKTEAFGFSWLVNDNDGQGRKYIQWSSGIGPGKTPSQFGMVKCITGK